MNEPIMTVVVIFQNPSDYPGKFVARRQFVVAGGRIVMNAEPLAVVDTLHQAREAVPFQQDYRQSRQPEDDPTIVETWV